MTQDDLTFLPLQVVIVGACGKRSFDPGGKRRLIDAGLQPSFVSCERGISRPSIALRYRSIAAGVTACGSSSGA